jgi:hypothetical protein
MKRTRIFALFLVIALIVSMASGYITQASALEEPSVTVSTLDELLTAIAEAEDGAVIGLDGQIILTYSVMLGSESKSITLQKVSPNSNIYISSTSSATIRNITFDGAEVEGTQAFLQSDSYVMIENCVFKNHYSTGHGAGAVAIFNGMIEFYNCSFQNNTASPGGHIFIGGMCTANIENCTFTNGSDSAISNNGTCNIKGSLLTENQGAVGGAIRNSGILTIEKSKIYKNTAEVGNDISTGTGSPITFVDSAAELNALYAADGFTAEWVKDTVSSPLYGNYITWELVLTAIPEEPTEPEQPEEPTDPAEPEEPKTPDDSDDKKEETPIQPNNTTNTVGSNPSTKITIEEPLGNVENHITITTPSGDAQEAYINGYLNGNNQGGTSTPIEQTIRVEAAQAPTGKTSEPNTLNINITVGSDLPSSKETVQADNQITWYQVAVLCLLFGILCSLILLSVSFFLKK